MTYRHRRCDTGYIHNVPFRTLQVRQCKFRQLEDGPNVDTVLAVELIDRHGVRCAHDFYGGVVDLE